jgi:hypothetical protein
MAKFTGILGSLALIFGFVDLIHGPHNGDAHRFFIHIAEFISFSGFLCILEIWAFRVITRELNLNRWLLVTCLSLLTCVLSLILFGLAGGSFHGDGGPIAFSFLLFYAIGATVVPVSFIVFVVVAISRKRNGVPMFDK